MLFAINRNNRPETIFVFLWTFRISPKHLEIKFYIFVCVCVSEYTYGYRNAHKTNNMQPSLIHYEFVTLFFDRGLTSEKYQTDAGKYNINK